VGGLAQDDWDELLEVVEEVVVVTASKQSEPVQEVPVPVTVITSEMIQNSGALTLKDLLITYVPGFSFSQDHNEINIAMRGIYASSQQKVLIFLDGFRLNSRAYSEANPDFSISLDKIKQIEILRGPGSPLYGNVALTAVINIITKSGNDLNGTQVSVSAGNYGQKRGSFVCGKTFDASHEVLLWGTFYEAKGEKVDVPAEKDYTANPQGGEAIVGGVTDRPAYDVGVKYRFGDFKLLATQRYNHYIEPFSGGGATGQLYHYADYNTLDGEGPGLSSQSAHFGLEYHKQLSEMMSVDVQTYYNLNHLNTVLILAPAVKMYAGPRWDEYSTGGTLQLNRHYQWRLGSGNVLLGAQIDKMRVYDSSFPIGNDAENPGEWSGFIGNSQNPLLELGEEVVYSGFGQIKHRFNDRWILNTGFRFDNKDRHKGDNLTDFSPRLALIFLPSDQMEIRASYAESFVDGPYWYRYNSLASYQGAESLKPEYLTAYQLTPTFRWWNGRLVNRLNLYYSELTDFIWRNNDPEAEIKYQNAGSLESWGIEGEIDYLHPAYKIRANFTYQRAVDAVNYAVTDEQIHNVPNLFGNLIVDVKPFYRQERDLWVNLTARYVGKQLSPINIVASPEVSYNFPENEVDAVVLFNAGVRYNNIHDSGVSVDFRIYNLLDEEYEQGGSVVHPYPQPGRWLLATIGYRF